MDPLIKVGGYKHISVLFLSLAVLGTPSCKREEKFPDLGSHFANPADVGVSDDGQYFYVLNSDFERTFNKGSILVLNQNGERQGVVEVPRLGRTITIAGTDMLVTYDRPDPDSDAVVQLFDLSSPKEPRLVKTFNPPCVPINAVMRKNYKYFAVSCISTETSSPVLVGELKTSREESSLQVVREYGTTTRRALHIDTNRNLLFGFVTDIGKQNLFESAKLDTQTVTDTAVTQVPNEVPDEWEQTQRLRSNTARNETYQFFVYDLAAEAAKGFPNTPSSDPSVRKELRWLYFCLSNFDGAPDPDGVCDGTVTTISGAPHPGTDFKLYRTNFWESRPDPTDPNSFYLSHRGVGGTLFANDVVKVSITADPHIDGSGNVPKTSDIMTFQRVYGFPGEVEISASVADLHYPGDLEVLNINGRNMLVVNHFRDLVYWKKGEYRFGITSKILGENDWFSETLTDDPSTSYYQVAVAPDGKGISCSFYGNTVMLLDIAPGTDIKTRKLE